MSRNGSSLSLHQHARQTWIIVGLGSLAFLSLMACYDDFVLDDAFISYRYAKNLAQGHGIVWNVGEDPVEGYTSFLWVVLNALGIYCGLEPVVFSKVLSAASALALIGLLAAHCRKGSWGPAWIVTSAVFASPLFAFLTAQGLETTLTSLLLCLAGARSLRVVYDKSYGNTVALYLYLFLGMLSRPDVAPFAVGVASCHLILHFRHNDTRAVKMMLRCSIPFVLTGLVYMAWRLHYFGYLFPNTFYIKATAEEGLFKIPGLQYVKSFLTDLLWPYLGLLAAAAILRFSKERFEETAPILLGCAFHFMYLTTIVPIQGFFWRFAFPIFPVLLLAVATWFYSNQPSQGSVRSNILWALLALLFMTWNLRFLPETFHQEQYRSQHDRVMAGRSLAGMDGVMLVTASGALPFYSQWTTVDVLGLNSEVIAHGGLSRKLLDTLSPDLIALHSLMFERKVQKRLVITEYMVDNDYAAVAFVYRSPDFYMCYFARKSSPLFEEIQHRLTGIEGLQYGDLTALMNEDGIQVEKVY